MTSVFLVTISFRGLGKASTPADHIERARATRPLVYISGDYYRGIQILKLKKNAQFAYWIWWTTQGWIEKRVSGPMTIN